MAKNFKDIYDDTGDSSAQNQSFFIKEESVRGTFSIPTGSDFLFTLSGGSTNFSQPRFSSPHRDRCAGGCVVSVCLSVDRSTGTVCTASYIFS